MVEVTRQSPFSGKLNSLELPITQEAYDAGMEAYKSGRALIQDAFPTLSADLREFIKTGITPAEWDAAFAEEDDEPYVADPREPRLDWEDEDR